MSKSACYLGMFVKTEADLEVAEADNFYFERVLLILLLFHCKARMNKTLNESAVSWSYTVLHLQSLSLCLPYVSFLRKLLQEIQMQFKSLTLSDHLACVCVFISKLN